MDAARALGMCRLFTGDLEAARELLQTSNRIYDPARHHVIAFRHGVDPGVVGLVIYAWAAGLTGDASTTARCVDEALALAERVDHRFSRTYALAVGASAYQAIDDFEKAEPLARRAVELATSRGYPYWNAWGEIMLGWCEGRRGRAAEGCRRIRAGLDAYTGLGAALIESYALALLAQTLSTANRPADARAALAHARAVAARQGVVLPLPNIERLEQALGLENAG